MAKERPGIPSEKACRVQQRGLDILGRKYGRLDQRPVDGEVGVVPGNATFELRIVVIRRLVEKFRVFAERDEAMRKAGRHPELLAVFRRQPGTDPAAESRRI